MVRYDRSRGSQLGCLQLLEVHSMHEMAHKAVGCSIPGELDRQWSISELQGDPLHYVMEYLDTKSLCSAVQVRLIQRRVNCLRTHMSYDLALCRSAKVGTLQVCKDPFVACFKVRRRSVRPHLVANRT